ncbi:MAG: MotB family protein [Hyphomicrobium sp.]
MTGEGGEDTQQHELVIIRRRNGGEDAPHKGGVWKIAHADFMTALMAFFLVMWLINATDDKTVTGVANYFNPMRLTDPSAKPKGIHNEDPGSDRKDGGAPGTSDAGKNSGSRTGKGTDQPNNAEAAMFGEPYEVLDKLAAEAGKGPPALQVTERGNPLGHNTGEAFRDPFDPESRYDAARQGEAEQQSAEKSDAAPVAKEHGPASESGPASEPGPQAGAEPSHAESSGAGADAGRGEAVASDNKPASEQLRAPIEEAVKQTGFDPIPGIDVKSTDEGLLISITDQPDFEMFGIASARPKPELVVLMERIGKVLGERTEHIVIRGHTDGRPFRSGGYDNWRLSTARAQMAYYMLIRSGIPEARIDRIEGHADHKHKNAAEPLAAENRRIEILLEKGKS